MATFSGTDGKTLADGGAVPTLSSLGGVAAVSNVKTYMGGYENAVTASSNAATCDFSLGSTCYVAMQSGSTAWTLTLSNPVSGQVYRIVFKQNAAGNGPTPTFNPTVTWKGGSAPTITASAGKHDFATCYYSGADSAYYCDVDANF
jgi:hypothetical protein